jgi:Zn-dependent peptidase ImmA (M78 family)
MQECKAAAENTVNDREKMVEVKRKIGILKEALLTERQSNRNLDSQIYERGERLKKMELESKKREEKNEALLL